MVARFGTRSGPGVPYASSAEPSWCSVNEVAVHLGAADAVYRWIENKGLPAHRVGRLWKCKLPEVDAWVRGRGPTDTCARRKKSQRRRSRQEAYGARKVNAFTRNHLV